MKKRTTRKGTKPPRHLPGSRETGGVLLDMSRENGVALSGYAEGGMETRAYFDGDVVWFLRWSREWNSKTWKSESQHFLDGPEWAALIRATRGKWPIAGATTTACPFWSHGEHVYVRMLWKEAESELRRDHPGTCCPPRMLHEPPDIAQCWCGAEVTRADR